MVVENTTPNRGWSLPFLNNDLRDDVERLIDALEAADVDVQALFTSIAGFAPIVSPEFTDVPTAPTAVPGTDTNQLATTAFVAAALAVLRGDAPEELDTLGELVSALALKASAADMVAALALKQNIVDRNLLSGFRNKIINGDFDVWQRATSQTGNGYGSDDRWRNTNSGTTKVHSRQSFTTGQTDVPGNPKYYSRTVVSSVAGAGNYCQKIQKVENVRTISGKTVTYTFWAKADVAGKKLAISMDQSFGTGGSPSGGVTGIGARTVELTTAWAKYSEVFEIPDLSGKTIGTDENSCINVTIWFDAGSTWDALTANLGQQSGTFDIAHASLVEGDATGELDPFSPRHLQQEIALCQRYYEQDPGSGTESLLYKADCTSGSTYFAMCRFAVPKRTTPAITLDTANGGFIGFNSATVSVFSSNATGFRAVCTCSSTAAARQYNVGWFADAEL